MDTRARLHGAADYENLGLPVEKTDDSNNESEKEMASSHMRWLIVFLCCSRTSPNVQRLWSEYNRTPEYSRLYKHVCINATVHHVD